jgi:hypothetical protein
MKVIVLISLIIVPGIIARAQAPDTLWTRTCGGFFNDYGNSVDITFEGDYIVAGETFSLESGSYDIYIIKINAFGDTLWSRTYGGINSEYGHSIIQTSDSGFAVVGETRSFGAGSYDIYFLKTNAGGDTLWTGTYGGDDYEEGHSIIQTPGCGYIITGSTRSSGYGDDDICLVRTDSLGNIAWIRTFGGLNHDSGNSVEHTGDSGFIIAGETESFGMGSLDGYVVRTDANGDTLWTKTFGGTDEDAISCIQATSDGGFILAGYTSSFGAGMADGYLIRIDESGDTLWSRTYGGAEDDYIYSVRQTSDGGYVLAGKSESYHVGGADVYIIKTDSLGDIIWSGNYGGPGEDIAYSIRQTSDDGYIMAGATTSYGAGGNDVYVIRLLSGQTYVGDSEIFIKPGDFELCYNYPNPFNASTTISFEMGKPAKVKLAVYDLLGREIAVLADRYLESGSYSCNFAAPGLTSGIYFYRLRAGNAAETRRMVLLK